MIIDLKKKVAGVSCVYEVGNFENVCGFGWYVKR